jgi:aminoglycoside phosphotransferase (APT) family kinase protein
MIHGAPDESRWLRPEPRRSLPRNVLQKIVETAFPGHSVVEVQPLTDGFRNANFRVWLDSKLESVVLRMYEHDASLCRKEIDLLNLISHSVPTPEIIHAEPSGMNEVPPFLLLRYIEGLAFGELKRNGDANSVSQAAFDAGRTLALIGRTRFPRSGWLGPGPSATAPLLEGINPGPRFVDLCLGSSNVRERVKEELRDQTSALVWSYATQLGDLDNETNLVHGDFGNRNLLVQKIGENWTVAAVLDWEFAIAGSPLADIGHFLRYEAFSHSKVEPHFSNGYLQAGGRLPHGWRRLARVIDLIALCESLTHDVLPQPVIAELIELVSATVEGRDPQFS